MSCHVLQNTLADSEHVPTVKLISILSACVAQCDIVVVCGDMWWCPVSLCFPGGEAPIW